ncbi:MAG: TQO small subunit DoxD [Rhodomicrobium sp.]
MTALSAGRAEPVAEEIAGSDWRYAAIAMLPVRIIQGFIYWGGGSRRFFYAPGKLDPEHQTWIANKFQSAMPGALLGLDRLIAYMLQHFWLLYAGVILFSAVELFAGAALTAGLMTRLAALISMGLSIVLMLMFGWQGGTCIDEWTMAACNLAMGAALMLAGSGAYSLDNELLHRNPALAGRGWFRWAGGSLKLPMTDKAIRNLGMAVLAFVLAFDIGIYSYYRGSVVTLYHGGPVSPSEHHFTLSDATLLSGGGVRFHIYLDGGTAAVPAHLMQAELARADGKTLADWNTVALTGLPASAIVNDFAYNRFKAGPYGLAAEMGASATVSLPPRAGAKDASAGAVLKLTDVNGRSFTVKVTQGT